MNECNTAERVYQLLSNICVQVKNAEQITLQAACVISSSLIESTAPQLQTPVA
jgi:hypothetical protein